MNMEIIINRSKTYIAVICSCMLLGFMTGCGLAHSNSLLTQLRISPQLEH